MSVPGPYLEIQFEGFWLCRLATDPDPSLEQRGISGFTFAVAGEDLLDPSFFSQAEDVHAAYGMKDPEFQTGSSTDPMFDIRNIRRASPDYERYNNDGIGMQVTQVLDRGQGSATLTDRLSGMQVRFASDGVPGHDSKGPIFEGRNQIVSDGDPDRFTLNPLVFQVRKADPNDSDRVVVQRFDPLVVEEPYRPLYEIVDNAQYIQRWPTQRFPTSDVLLAQLGIDNAEQHFVRRAQWLEEKIAEAEALGRSGLAEAYRTRRFGVEFFTQATGPTVLENRLASRIPLRQLYKHELRGSPQLEPTVIAQASVLDPGGHNGTFEVLTDVPWPIQYYLGGYDGDLMAGFATGFVRLPYLIR